MIIDEENAGINKKLKKKKNTSSIKRPSFTRVDNLENIRKGQEGIEAYIGKSQDWLGFTTLVNRLLGLVKGCKWHWP